MEKRGKSEFWRRREAFAREIERDTKEKSEQVAQRLAQAVRADEEKQAGRRAARGRAAGRAGGPARQPGAKAQAARTDGWGRSGPARTRAGAWDERESGPARTKISARGEAAGGAHPRTGAQSGAPHAGELERAPGLHTMELRMPGPYLTGTEPGGMMEEISRRLAAVQPGSPALRPSPMPPAQRVEALPVPTGTNSEIQLLAAQQHTGDSGGYTEEELRDEINRILDEQYPNTANGFETNSKTAVPFPSFLVGSLADMRMNHALDAIQKNSDIIKQTAMEYGMPPEVIASIILKEQYTQSLPDWAAILRSNWKKHSGSTGLGAIRAETARDAWENYDKAIDESLPKDNTELLRQLAHDDEFNIDTIAAVLAMEAQRARNNGELSEAETMQDFTQDDWKQVLRAYNAGWSVDEDEPGRYTGGYRYADYTAEYMPYLKYFLEG